MSETSTGECVDCGEYSIVLLMGMCPKCHQEYDNAVRGETESAVLDILADLP